MNRPGWPTVVIASLASAAITWLIALAVLGGTDTTTVKVVAGGGHRPDSEGAAPASPAEGAAARIVELEREVAALKSARAPKPRAAAPAREAPPAPAPSPGGTGPTPADLSISGIRWSEPKQLTVSGDDARHAAERYAATVRAGSDGAAWLPLAVAGPANRPDAWAPLDGIVRDSEIAPATRAATLDALSAAGRDVARTAEDVLATSQDADLRAASLRAILASVRGGAAIPQVVRSLLGDSSATADERDMALTIVALREPATALPLIEALVTSTAADERDRGLNILLAQRNKAYLPLMTRVAQRDDLGDRVPGVTEAIADTKDKKWSALQMTGEPDTPASGDFGTAWAAKAEQMGLVTLELTFPRAVPPESIRIRETLAAGAIASLSVETNGSWDVVWEGHADAGDASRWFEPGLRSATGTTRRVRVVVDTDRCAGWEEIDAVELVGGGVRQWASAATATSSYAD